MRVWVVGSGTLRPDPLRGSPAYWIEGDSTFILLDCGTGAIRTLARLARPWEAVTHVVVSHLHTDHVGELAPLLFALKHGLAEARTEPLLLLGPPGLVEHLQDLSRAHGSYVLDPGFPVEVEELAPGEVWDDFRTDITLLTRSTPHTENSQAVRFEFPEGALGYTGDTGPSPDLGTFFRGCRLLIAECSHPDGQGADNHLTPSSLAEMAGEAAPELLVTVHAYPPLDPAQLPDLLAGEGYRGRVCPGEDGLLIECSDKGILAKKPTEQV